MNLTNTMTKAVVVLIASAAVLGFAFSAKAACTPTTTYGFTATGMTLRQGAKGPAVVALQTGLKAFGGATNITIDGSYGPMTASAVGNFQSMKMLTADKVAGPMTQNALAAASATTTSCDSGNGGSNGSLNGGAGSITVDDSSEFSGEEVGEGEEEAQVLQFSVEADDESDVDITSVKVEFVESGSTSSEDLDDYVESVSIWFDGEEVGSADVDSFSENSDVWTKSISLDGAIVQSGEEMDFVVAVNALGNLDSGDIDSDLWTVDVVNVRFEDGDGVVTTEDTDGDSLEQTFDFASFASATDLDLKFKLNPADDDINEAHVIDVDNSDDTDNVEILSFTVEADGESDVNISELPVTITTTGETDEAVIVNSVHLIVDGDEVATEDVPTGGAVTFEDLDIDIDAGDTVEMMITVDLQNTDGALDNGDTVKAEITTGNVDAIEAEDETGEDLSTSDTSGSALGEASTVYDAGIMAKFVSANETITPVDGGADVVNFTIVFDVTAFDTDAFVDGTAITDEAGGATYQNISADGIVGTGVLNSNADDAANSTFEVSEGTTERFTLTVSGDGTGAFAKAALESILWATTAIDGDQLYTFNMSDYETESLYVSSS